MRVLLLVLVAWGLLWAWPAPAADLHGVTGFDEFAEEHPGVAAALQKHPSFAADPDYLQHHPGLAEYLKHSPIAADELAGEDDTDDSANPTGHKYDAAGDNLRHGLQSLPNGGAQNQMRDKNLFVPKAEGSDQD
jgi:hypothetical protein